MIDREYNGKVYIGKNDTISKETKKHNRNFFTFLVFMLKKCLVCGKEYVKGTYHGIHCSVIYKNDRKSYDWNCSSFKSSKLHEIEERIIASYIGSKSKLSLIYE